MKLRLAAFALLAAAPAWAQTPQQPQPAAADRRATTGARELNLNLNESELRALSRGSAELRDPPAEQAAGGLPTLGGDARPMERPKASSGSTGAYPVDSERARQ